MSAEIVKSIKINCKSKNPKLQVFCKIGTIGTLKELISARTLQQKSKIFNFGENLYLIFAILGIQIGDKRDDKKKTKKINFCE